MTSGASGARVARPSNTRERRQQIVEALLAVMGERGYGGASIQAIARRAGLASGLIHYHFASKQEILLEAVRQLTTLVEQRYQALAQQAPTPRDRLRAFIDARLARGAGASPAAVAAWVIVGAEAVRQPEVKAAYQAAMRAQQALLEPLLQDLAGGELSSLEARHLCGVVLAAIEGAFQLSVSANDIMPTDYAARTLMDLIERRLQGGARRRHT